MPGEEIVSPHSDDAVVWYCMTCFFKEVIRWWECTNVWLMAVTRTSG